jgi:uncharacterized protein YgbK (DUF1537 family)
MGPHSVQGFVRSTNTICRAQVTPMGIEIGQIEKSLPPVLKVPSARQEIRRLNQGMSVKIVVLDDDPTGCQTVHNITVLTNWEPQILQEALCQSDLFFVLTNSRAFPEREAVAMNRQIVERLLEFADLKTLRIVSRSDSTLRGHFAGETGLLLDLLGPFDGVLIVPYFKAGGRLTLNNTHYVLQEEELVEAHNTEYARDPVFGFKSSYLPAWVEEKARGFWRNEDVTAISLDDIRLGGPDRVCQKLKAVRNAQPVIINALCDEDLEVAVLGLCRAEAQGKRFLYRTAASFVKIRAGMQDVQLYTPPKGQAKGLVIVGSYVEKTTEQVNYLTRRANVHELAVRISKVLNDTGWVPAERGPSTYLTGLTKAADDALAEGKSVVAYTDREYALSGDDEAQLGAAKRISNFLCDVVAEIRHAPDYIIAKGGITSYDVAKKGLGVKRALVLGQILPGVPIWQLGDESKYPGLLYVVFPGNVGSEKSLYEAYTKFSGALD